MNKLYSCIDYSSKVKEKHHLSRELGMSTFNALNFTHHDELLEAEEHSRELQIEESFKIFQGALYDLKAKRYAEADVKFQELFSMEVLKPNKWGFYKYSSPTLDSLRYLAYRNRGMYYYSYLTDNYQKLEAQDAVDIILKVLECLVESIQHSEADSSVTQLLTQIFRSYKSKKLERLTLECELTKPENQLFLLGRRRKGLLPSLKEIIGQYQDLLKNIKEDELSDSPITRDLLGIRVDQAPTRVLNPLLANIQKMKTIDENTMKELDGFEIPLKESSWEAIACSLKHLVPHIKTSVLIVKSTDPYSEVEFPIEAVRFVMKEAEEEVSVKEEVEQDDSEGHDASRASTAPVSAEAPNGKSTENGTDLLAAEHNSKKRSLDESESQQVAQRSSKRFREKDTESTEENTLKPHRIFLSDLSAILNKIRYTLPFSGDECSLEMTYPDSKELLPQYDLMECTKGWTSWHSDIFMHNDMKSGATTSKGSSGTGFLQVNTLLKSNVFGDKTNSLNDLSILDEETVQPFLESTKEHAMHFQEVRFRLLLALLSFDGKLNKRLIVDQSWSSKLFEAIEWFFFGVERSLFQFILDDRSKHSHLALSAYELMVNMMGSICEEIAAKKLHGNKTSDLNNQKNQLEKKIERWHDLLNTYDQNDEKWSIQFEWVHYCYLQYSCEIIDDRLLSALNSIETKLESFGEKFQAMFPNYRHIPPLHLGAVHSQSRKIKIIRKISVVDASGHEQKEEDAQQHISLLQQVLLLDLYPERERPDDVLEMLSFISNSPFLLKVKLWEVLFTFYLNKNEINGVLRIYFLVLTFFTKFLSSEQYCDRPSKGRQQLLLTTQSNIASFTSKVTAALLREAWVNVCCIERENFELLLKAFSLFYPVLYFESLLKADGSSRSFFRKATKSSSRMKDTITDMATLLLYFSSKEASRTVPPQEGLLTAELVECFHRLMGDFKFCDASNGSFLKLSESLLCRYAENNSLAPLKQILWCRYHYLIAGDNFQPVQHATKEILMDRANSLPLGVYLIKLQYQGKNPLLASGSKASLKPVLDSIIDTIGDPMSSGSHIVERNKFFLEEYLDRPITAQSLRNAFQGKRGLTFTTPRDELQESISAGLFYVAGIQALNLYRARKKSMQARPSELDSIIALLKNDIIYNTNRFESWYMLGRCYAFIVEDDLMWTSDKLTVPEKKNVIALTQRKSILCYKMCLQIFYSQKPKNSEDEIVAQKALEALGNELISGKLKPMDNLCFSWRRPHVALKLTSEGELLQERQSNAISISHFNIDQGILMCLQRANISRGKLIAETSRNWMNYYLIGKLLFKSEKTKYWSTAYQNIMESCILASGASAPKDPILEPHYYLVNMCYKAVKEGVISPSTALSSISKDSTFFTQEEPFWTLDSALTGDYQKKVFYDKILKLLTFILASDKKKWHHRPRYRIAKILFEDFQNLDGAIEEMTNFMSIRSTHKNLVNIWKPDFERAGKHFVYTYQYVMFYLDMLEQKGDYNSIGLVCKKIRRFGSGMAYVNMAAEHATALYTKCARNKLQVDEKACVEKLLPSLHYQQFIVTTEELVKTFKLEDYPEHVTQALKIAFQLKRGNNGIAFDGICLAIFFQYFYLPVKAIHIQDTPTPAVPLQSEPEQGLKGLAINSTTVSKAGSPSPTNQKPAAPRKRVSKRDAFDKVRLIAEKIT